MNIYLSLAVLFTMVFVMYAIQSINYYIVLSSAKQKLKGSLNEYAPFISALLASAFWGLAF